MIVIGAGGGGAVIAKELAERGLDVLVLEAGPRFADPEREWSHFSQDAVNAVTGYFRWGPADRSKPPYARELNSPTMLVLQVAGVGGATLHLLGDLPARDAWGVSGLPRARSRHLIR